VTAVGDDTRDRTYPVPREEPPHPREVVPVHLRMAAVETDHVARFSVGHGHTSQVRAQPVPGAKDLMEHEPVLIFRAPSRVADDAALPGGIEGGEGDDRLEGGSQASRLVASFPTDVRSGRPGGPNRTATALSSQALCHHELGKRGKPQFPAPTLRPMGVVSRRSPGGAASAPGEQEKCPTAGKKLQSMHFLHADVSRLPRSLRTLPRPFPPEPPDRHRDPGESLEEERVAEVHSKRGTRATQSCRRARMGSMREAVQAGMSPAASAATSRAAALERNTAGSPAVTPKSCVST
jgi:hypothetical protein